jgi:WD40 repeat protein
LVATGDATGVIKVWQTQVPGPITLENAPDGSDLAVFTPKLDKVVAANAQYGSGLWETTLGKRVETLGKEFRSTTWLEGASFSADGSKLFLTGGSGLMSGDLWELSPGGETKHLWHIERPCTAGMLSADAECVAIGETNGAVTILNLKTRTPERSLSFTTNRIFNVVLSPDRRLVAASDYADAVCVWRLPSGEKAFASGGGAPSRLAFMNHSPKLVGWSANEVQIWNCEKGQRELHFETPNSWALAISPDDRRIATSGTWGNPTIQLWDTVTGEETLRLRTITEIIVRLAFSADGKRLGAITHQSRVQFWDAE